MVRENAGYALEPGELGACRRATMEFGALGVDGIVLGFADGERLALSDVARVVEGGPAVRVTFHRAFDQLADPLDAIDSLAEVPCIDRVLTSGGQGAAGARVAVLRACALRAGRRLTILAGGGIDAEMVRLLSREAALREIHVGRAARRDAQPDGPVSAARVRTLRRLMGRPD